MSVKSAAAAQRDRERAERAQQVAAGERARAQQEAQQREKAESKVLCAQGGEILTRRKYKSVFTGVLIFTVTLAVLNLYAKSSVFAECGEWFKTRAAHLWTFLLWLKGMYLSTAALIGSKLPANAAPAVLGYVISGLIAAAVLVGLYLSLKWVFATVGEKVRAIRRQYTEGELKAILTASVAISMFYACLFLYEQIKAVLPLNIFSVWLLLSLISAAIINCKEIIGGVKRGY